MNIGPMNVFIIMPFAPKFNDSHAAILAAVAAAFPSNQAVALRLDAKHVAGNIVQQLIENIHRADIVIAEISGFNPNVMWELGFASAIRRPCVLVHRGTIGTLPFDLRTERVLQYKPTKLDRLRIELKNALVATAAKFHKALPRHRIRDHEYDEVQQLASSLAAKRVKSPGKNAVSLLDMLATTIRKNNNFDWSHPTPRELFELMDSHFSGVRVDDALWWLIEHGVLEFRDIDNWQNGDDDSWEGNVDATYFSIRGSRLLNAIAKGH